ncbi:MAG: type 1 glutamine amidotransferase domain-containing protein [Alkalispirochaetaceae bacterium]
MATQLISLLYHEVEDLEFWYPTLRLREAGATVVVAGEAAGRQYIGKYGVPAEAQVGFDDLDPGEYDGILVPGGWAPDKLRRFPSVLELVRKMNDEGKIIGEICHAGWVLISAGILEGRKVTSTPGIKDDMVNAGAVWLDEPVVVDRNIVSSRRPPDLPEYAKALLKALGL